ncbi:MAG: hypothetical protein WB766_02900, partial [Roseiarcus sp.]
RRSSLFNIPRDNPPPCPDRTAKKSLIKQGTCWRLAEGNETYEILHYFKRLKAPIWRLKIAVSVVRFRPWAPLHRPRMS